MEGAFEEVALGILCHRAVSVEVTVPLSVDGIWEVGVGPVADLAVELQIALVSGHLVGVEGGDDCLCLGPPELHVLSIVLTREALAVTEVDDAPVLLVPAPCPGPVEDLLA